MKRRFVHLSMLLIAGLFGFSSAKAQMDNGGFETGDASGWNITGTADGVYTTSFINKADEPDNVKEGKYSLKYDITAPVVNDWDIQLRNETVKVKKDSIYVFSFWAKATVDMNGDPAVAKIQVEDRAIGWPPHYRMGMLEGNDKIPIEKIWTKYSLVYIASETFDAVNNFFMYAFRPQSAATYYVDDFEMKRITDLGSTMKTALNATGNIIHLTVPSSITNPSGNEEFLKVSADGVNIPVDSTEWSKDQGHLVIDIALSQSVSNAKNIVLNYDKLGYLQFGFMVVTSLPSFSVIVKQDGTTGIEAAKCNQTNVFPTYATDYINVKSEKSITQVSILNTLGQTMKNLNMNAIKESRISLSNLKSGIYFIKVRTLDNSNETYKIIKK